MRDHLAPDFAEPRQAIRDAQETFVVDGAGIIRYKQIGPVTAEALERKILPLVRELQKS